jgi:methionyl aminopeptidase
MGEKSKMYTNKQLDQLRESGAILRDTLEMLSHKVHAGVSTLELDTLAEEFIRSRGGEPAFKDYQGYKHTLCTSINEESVHGIPSDRKELQDGDIISLDCGVRFPIGDGMCTDAARTYFVGPPTETAKKLVETTEQCFFAAVNGLKAGQRVKTIGKKIEKFIDGRYGIVNTYFGHGIGKTIHEGVLIPNFDVDAQNTPRRVMDFAQTVLNAGDIICIEPMINAGTRDLKTAKDGWTAVTTDGELAAHYENTLIITADGVEIVTN